MMLAELRRRPPAPRAGRGIWIIYDHPTDFPDAFVARWWQLEGGTARPSLTQFLTAPSLTELRAKIPGITEMLCFGRDAFDQPHIVESWF